MVRVGTKGLSVHIKKIILLVHWLERVGELDQCVIKSFRRTSSSAEEGLECLLLGISDFPTVLILVKFVISCLVLCFVFLVMVIRVNFFKEKKSFCL